MSGVKDDYDSKVKKLLKKMRGVTISCQNMSIKRYGTIGIRRGCANYIISRIIKGYGNRSMAMLTPGEPIIVCDTHRTIGRGHLQQLSSVQMKFKNSNYDVSDAVGTLRLVGSSHSFLGGILSRVSLVDSRCGASRRPWGVC